MKNKKNIILIIIFVILLGVLFLIIDKDKNNNIDKEETISYKYEIVNDYSVFFTIENCVNKYFNYLSINDIDSLNKILDNNYIVNNKYINRNISIRLNGMYNYNNTYYVKGTVYEELKSSVNKLDDEFLIVKVDSDFKLFTIIPIDKISYDEAINEK